MSIGQFVSTVANAQTAATASSFSPTILGRTTTDTPASQHVVIGDGFDFRISPASASSNGFAGVWVIRTVSDTFIRVGCDATGTSPTEAWFNGAGVSQGDPGSRAGTGTTVFQLNDVADEVRITNVGDTTVFETPSFGNITGGSAYTSGTFFTPTNDTKYGREVLASASQSGLGLTTEIGYTRLSFTFRKSGLNDYTVDFTARGEATANVDI